MGFYKDITGKRYGSLTVLGFSHSENGFSFWECIFDCGNKAIVSKNNLNSGNTKTCGCSHHNRPHIDRTGKRYGRLVAIKDVGRNERGDIMWLCKCDCGNETIVSADSLHGKGGTQSCGCLIKDRIREALVKHDESGTRLYRIYHGLFYRCYNPHSSVYKNYGGRGIGVCDEWSGENGFYNFRDWAQSNGYKDNLSLDRIDFTGDYSPTNCRWVTQKEQCNNKRTNVTVSYNGQEMTLSQFCDLIGAPYKWVYTRFHGTGKSIDSIAKEWRQKEVGDDP